MRLLAALIDPSGRPVLALAVYLSAAVLGYVVGSLNPATTVARLRGTDLRSVGSGNPGATNAGRAFGWKVGLLVGLLDVLKGLLPVLVATWVAGPYAGAVAGVAAVLGHVTSPFLHGRGGKGVATSFGAILGVDPLWAVPVLVVFGLTFAVTRRVGLSSVAGALALVPTALLWGDGWVDVLFALALAGIVVVRHRRNLEQAAGHHG